MSKQSPLESFDTKLFINEIEKLPAIWDSLPEGHLAIHQMTSLTCENTFKKFTFFFPDFEKIAYRTDPFLALYTAEDEPSTCNVSCATVQA